MNVGAIGVVEGFTRSRTVASGAARHLGGFVGVVFGVVATGHAFGNGIGNEWFGRQGFFLSGVDLSARAFDSAPTTGAQLVLLLALSVLFVTLAMAALAERTTFVAHVVCGLLSGGLLVPLAKRSLAPEGILGSISVGDSTFVDSSAATIFSVAGWLGLLGATVIGPRLGWIGSHGNVRVIPGKSPWLVSAGSLLFVAGSTGLAAYPDPRWADSVANAALSLVIGASAGASTVAGLGIGRQGEVTVSALSHGLLGGVVASSGALLGVSPLSALLLGALGGIAVHFTSAALVQCKIDDPAAAVASFGAAGVVGSLGAQAFEPDQLLAQIVGQLIVASWSIVVAGLIFGVLRGVRLLRISPDIEMVGLEG